MEDWLKTALAVSGLVSAAFAAIILYIRLLVSKEFGERINKLEAVDAAQEFKIRVVWEWVMRGALKEALEKGVLTMNSPITPTDIARDYFRSKGLIDRLHAYWKVVNDDLAKNGKPPESYEVQMRFANAFGEELWQTICADMGMDRGACLLAAIEVAKEVPVATPVNDPSAAPSTEIRS